MLGSRQPGGVAEPKPLTADRAPEYALGLGILFFTVIWPLLKRVPSVGAMAVGGANLVIVGLCLAGWRALAHGSRWRLLGWLVAAGMVPLVTMVTLGFLGYGAAALLAFVAFVSVIFRPRWITPLALVVGVYCGLTLFVNYMRERDEMRSAVWGGQSLELRLQRIGDIVLNFQFLDLHDRAHLASLDDRLNQNFLVGLAAERIELGANELLYGASVLEAVIGLVPRVIWPDKRVRAGGRGFARDFTGLTFAEGTSVGVGHVMELYINFGRTGMIIGFAILGFLLSWADRRSALALRQDDVSLFVLWYLPCMSCVNSGGSLFELFSSAASALLLAWLLRGVFRNAAAGSPAPTVPLSSPG